MYFYYVPISIVNGYPGKVTHYMFLAETVGRGLSAFDARLYKLFNILKCINLVRGLLLTQEHQRREEGVNISCLVVFRLTMNVWLRVSKHG